MQNIRVVTFGVLTGFGWCCSLYTDVDWNRLDPDAMVFFLQQFIQSKDLVFDVGAHVGKKAELYIKCGGRVVCFEPQKSCFKELKEHLHQYKENVVALRNCGIASRRGTLTIYECAQATTISSFSRAWVASSRFAQRGYTWHKGARVKVMTLDDAIASYGIPQFCKIDVEGFEYEVLRGLSYKIPYLCFECNIECLDSTVQCLDKLVALGYTEFNFAPAEQAAFIFPHWLSRDEFYPAFVEKAQDKCWQAIWGIWGDIYAH